MYTEFMLICCSKATTLPLQMELRLLLGLVCGIFFFQNIFDFYKDKTVE